MHTRQLLMAQIFYEQNMLSINTSAHVYIYSKAHDKMFDMLLQIINCLKCMHANNKHSGNGTLIRFDWINTFLSFVVILHNSNLLRRTKAKTSFPIS